LQICSTRRQDRALRTGIRNPAKLGPQKTDGDTASPLFPITTTSWERAELRAIPGKKELHAEGRAKKTWPLEPGGRRVRDGRKATGRGTPRHARRHESLATRRFSTSTNRAPGTSCAGQRTAREADMGEDTDFPHGTATLSPALMTGSSLKVTAGGDPPVTHPEGPGSSRGRPAPHPGPW